MQFDSFDNKVREAADHHYPAYDEQAWNRMCRLLDRHMPEEKKRRRGLFILLPVLLLLGGAAWYFFNSGQLDQVDKLGNRTTQSTGTFSAEKQAAPVSAEVRKDAGERRDEPTPARANGSGGENVDSPAYGTETPVFTREPSGNKRLTGLENRKTLQSVRDPNKSNDLNSPALPLASEVVNEKSKNNDKRDAPVDEHTAGSQPADPAAVGTGEDPGRIEGKAGEQPIRVDITNSVPETTPSVASADDRRKTPKKMASRLFFYVTGGPDLSFTKMENKGEWRLMKGAGFGFEVNDRFMLRTGVFSARKVYSALPAEYNPPANFWNYYPNLQSIDADCHVIEIPLLASYRFGKSDRQGWLASAGVSSFLMKEEKYQYYYKPYPNGPVYNQRYSIQNKNKHHFSMLTISGGYQRRFGKRITLTAEPYFKIPLTGVGFGKVKLNGGGVMVSVGINPF